MRAALTIISQAKIARMPTVDHDERRRRIAEITVDVIAREGLEAATIRRIAAELNGPTKLVTYYFADKHELLRWTYQSLAEQGVCNVGRVLERDPTDIVGSLFAMSPADEQGARLWRVYIAFWDWAARDPVVAELHRKHFDLALQRTAQIITARNGERVDLESVTERINAVVQGISIQALMDKDRWSAERIRSRLAEEVNALLGEAPRALSADSPASARSAHRDPRLP
jgi:TetR/AcrR family transcriptional regulator, transcriptional repressor of bet genes